MSNTEKLKSYRKQLLQCGGIVLDTETGRVNSNKSTKVVFFRSGRGDRLLLEHLLKNQNRRFEYHQLDRIFGGNASNLNREREKYWNDKIEAIKRKLLPLGFTRNELGDMLNCDRGYALMPPREGRKYKDPKINKNSND